MLKEGADLLDYTLPNGLPSGNRAAWSQRFVSPLASDGVTPFSASLLTEVTSRAWFVHYDRLGFEPMPRARVMRQHLGRLYFNLTMSAQREAECAATEPITLMLNGAAFPICKVESAGFLAGLKATLNERKRRNLLRTLEAELSTLTAQAQEWYGRVSELRWTQADVLQIMEEIEPASVPVFAALLGANLMLAQAVNRMLRAVRGKMAPGQALSLLDAILVQAEGLVESDMVTRLEQLAGRLAGDAAAQEWLQRGEFQAWATAPSAALVAGLQEFLTRYGHRALNDGELRTPRWQDDPTPLLNALRALVVDKRSVTPLTTPAQAMQSLSAALDSKQAKSLAEELKQAQQAISVVSHAFNSYAYYLSGARRWALAAGKEAMIDRRLLELGDVFFFEVEEMKEMMTGEWNVSSLAEIQGTAEKRKAQHLLWQQAAAPELLIGDTPAEPAAPAPAFAFNPKARLVQLMAPASGNQP